MLNRISFDSLDFPPPPAVLSAANAVSDFMLKYPSRIQDLSEFLQRYLKSYIHDWGAIYERWKGLYLAVSSAQDYKELTDVVKVMYKSCRNQDDVDTLRGKILERVAWKIFSKRYAAVRTKKFDQGCKVIVDGAEIRYQSPVSVYEHKVTVDIAFWDGVNGEYVELKLFPRSFEKKDYHYLYLLDSVMASKRLPKTIFIITLDNKNLTQSHIDSLGMSQKFDYKLAGRDELTMFDNPSFTIQ